MENKVVNDGIIARCWNGDIKLWKAFWFVNILGFAVAVLIGALFQAGAYGVFKIKLPGLINAIPILIIGFFSVVTLWRSAPDPRVSLKGALTRIWILAFSLYILSISYKFIIL